MEGDEVFCHPSDCPLARALKRKGYHNVLTGTIQAGVTVDGYSAELQVTAVLLNGEIINHHPMSGFGANEFKRIKKRIYKDPSTKAFVMVQHLN